MRRTPMDQRASAGSWRWAVGVLVALAALSPPPVMANDTAAPSIAELVTRLNSDDYWRREEATEKLLLAGAEAAAELGAAAESGQLEIAWRALQVLERQSASDDPATAEAAQEVLQRLARSADSTISRSADRALAGWRAKKQQAALATLQELGGHVQGGYDLPMFGVMAPAVIAAPAAVVGFAEADVPREVILARRDVAPDKAAEARPAEAAGVDVTKLADVFEEPAPPAVRPLAAPEPEPSAPTEPLADASPVAEAERALQEEAPGAEGSPAAEVAVQDEGETAPPATDPAAAAPADLAEDLAEWKELRDEPRVLRFAEAAVVARAAAVDLPLVEAAPEGVAFGGGLITVTGPVRSHSLYLDQNWKGGDDGLKHAVAAGDIANLTIEGAPLSDAALVHIESMTSLTYLSVRHAGFSKKGLQRLRLARPQLTIMAMGEALVGISGEPHEKGFLVTNVVEGSGAANAGLQLGDIVVSCDGAPIRALSDLTIEIFQRKVGEQVEVVFLRNEKRQTVGVTLGARQ